MTDYEKWYDEALSASNELGYSCMSAADVIKALGAELKDSEKSVDCFNAVIGYILGRGWNEEPLEFLRYWNQGDFDVLREHWPDAPKEIYYADALNEEKEI